MTRKLQVTWHESEAELYRLYRGEKNPHRRSHLHALWLLRQGKSLTDVAPIIGVHYRTLQSWVAWYRQGGLQEVLRRTPGYNAAGKVAKLNRIQIRAVLSRVATGVFKTIHQIKQWIEARWGVKFSYWGLYDLLRRNGARLKVPRPYATSANPEVQAIWKKKTFSMP